MFIREIIHLKKNKTYVVIIDKYEWEETHWIALYVNDDNKTYFVSFGAEKIS